MGNLLICKKNYILNKVKTIISVSEDNNKEANILFTNKSNKEAIQLYTNSIDLLISYKDYDIDINLLLSKYYSNRSYAYFTIKSNQKAIEDIDISISLCKSEWLKPYQRKVSYISNSYPTDKAINMINEIILDINTFDSIKLHKNDYNIKQTSEYKEILNIFNSLLIKDIDLMMINKEKQKEIMHLTNINIMDICIDKKNQLKNIICLSIQIFQDIKKEKKLKFHILVVVMSIIVNLFKDKYFKKQLKICQDEENILIDTIHILLKVYIITNSYIRLLKILDELETFPSFIDLIKNIQNGFIYYKIECLFNIGDYMKCFEIIETIDDIEKIGKTGNIKILFFPEIDIKRSILYIKNICLNKINQNVKNLFPFYSFYSNIIKKYNLISSSSFQSEYDLIYNLKERVNNFINDYIKYIYNEHSEENDKIINQFNSNPSTIKVIDSSFTSFKTPSIQFISNDYKQGMLFTKNMNMKINVLENILFYHESLILFKSKSILYENTTEKDEDYYKKRYGLTTFNQEKDKCIGFKQSSNNHSLSDITLVPFYKSSLFSNEIVSDDNESKYFKKLPFFSNVNFEMCFISNHIIYNNQNLSFSIVNQPDFLSLLYIPCLLNISKILFFSMDIFSLVKNIILFQMIRENVDNKIISEILFSSCLTKESFHILDKTIEELIERDLKIMFDNEEIEYIFNQSLSNSIQSNTLLYKIIINELNTIKNESILDNTILFSHIEKNKIQDNIILFHNNESRNFYFNYLLTRDISYSSINYDIEEEAGDSLLYNKIYLRYYNKYINTFNNEHIDNNLYSLIPQAFSFHSNTGNIISDFLFDFFYPKLNIIKKQVQSQKLTFKFYNTQDISLILNNSISSSDIILLGDVFDYSLTNSSGVEIKYDDIILSLYNDNERSKKMICIISNNWHNMVCETSLYDFSPIKRQDIYTHCTKVYSDYINRLKEKTKNDKLMWTYYEKNYTSNTHYIEKKIDWLLTIFKIENFLKLQYKNLYNLINEKDIYIKRDFIFSPVLNCKQIGFSFVI